MQSQQERYRDVKILETCSNGTLLYDLERTYIYDFPEHLDNPVSWPPASQNAEELTWFRENDLLTENPPPQKLEDPQAPPPQITDVSIDLPGNCNMGCTYCFEKPLFSRIGRMPEEIVEKTLDFAFNAAHGAPKVVLHFGSGEPLIEYRQLRSLVDSAMHRANISGQDVEFELTTNAILVTPEIARFFADNPFNIRVSCDGPEEVHDRFRPLLNGSGSYAKVVRGLEHLLEALPDRVTVNSVFCSGTRLWELWEWAKQLGIRHYHAIKVGSDEESDACLREEELAAFTEDTKRIASEIFDSLCAGTKPVDYHPLAKTVRRVMLPQPITRFCGVAGSYVGVAADGAVYPCFRHLGLKDYQLGDVEQGIDHDRRNRYRHAEAAEVDRRPVCSSCWARYICGGGCYADSVVYGPETLQPQISHCPYWRAEIAEGIRLYQRLRNQDPMLCLAMFEDDVDAILDNAEARILSQVRTF